MKYYEKHACGHEGMIDLVGPRSQREWKVRRYFEGDCPACQQKRRDEENAAAAERAKEIGLPRLIGTEKQVAWAESIRMSFYDASEAYALNPDMRYDQDQITAVIGCILEHEVYASFWIGNSSFRPGSFMLLLKDYYRANKEKVESYLNPPSPASAREQEDYTTTTMRPAKIEHDGIVTVEVLQTDDAAWTIRAYYVKDDAFRGVVTQRHVEWDKEKQCWARDVKVMYGPGNDRAAELISHLLKAGFCVRCDSEIVRDMVQSGQYQPELRLWVALKNKTTVRFIFDRDENLNEKIRRIGAKWDGKGYDMPVEQYTRIEEFARLFGFHIMPNVQEALNNARLQVEGAAVVDPTIVAPLRAKDNPLADILHSSRAVLDDLKDE